MKIATLQLNPRILSLPENIARANSILQRAFPSVSAASAASATAIVKPDLLVLPEMALCGYNYKSPQHVTPVLESPDSPGPMLQWAQRVSRQYGCFTVMGYPEAFNDKIYNSAVVYNRQGEIVHNYRKSFLYETDEVWGCEEGTGFTTFEIMDGVKASVGICMDLNPYKFKAPFNDFEFSNHCLRNEVNLMICPMNWLHGKSPSIQDSLSEEEKLERAKVFQSELDKVKDDIVINDSGAPIRNFEEKLDYNDLHVPDYHNLNYWLIRFFPFINHVKKFQFNSRARATAIYCNRSGLEDTILYGGTSSIVQYNGTAGLDGYLSFDLTNKSVDVLGALGKGDEGILVRDVEL